MTRTGDRTGILIVRLWVEHDVELGFRARVTQTMDSMGPEQGSALAATPQDLYAAVQTWVEAFVASSRTEP